MPVEKRRAKKIEVCCHPLLDKGAQKTYCINYLNRFIFFVKRRHQIHSG